MLNYIYGYAYGQKLVHSTWHNRLVCCYMYGVYVHMYTLTYNVCMKH